MFRFALFDLDNTLYPQDSGLWEEIGRRISAYMIDRLGFYAAFGMAGILLVSVTLMGYLLLRNRA